MNEPFTKADLTSHILWMCPLKEKSNAQSNEKASNKSENGNKRPGTESMARVLKKICFKKLCDLCKKHDGACTMHNTKDCHQYEKDGSEKADFCTAKKGGKKPNPAKNSFVQLSKKLEKLEKAIKKQGTKSKKCLRDNSGSDSEK